VDVGNPITLISSVFVFSKSRTVLVYVSERAITTRPSTMSDHCTAKTSPRRAPVAAHVRATDLLIFMEREHYEFCEGWIDSIRPRIEVWDVPDIGPSDPAVIMKSVSQTFDLIRPRRMCC
jgi:hypothetical protein